MVEINEQEYQKLKSAAELAENTISAIREPLIVLDAELKVVSASRSFYAYFKVKPAETEGRFIYKLGNDQWDIPSLRKLLEEIIPENESFDDYEVEHDFPAIGRRVMLLNARRIPRPPDKLRMILLAFEDITERQRKDSLAVGKLRASENIYQTLVESASDQIFMVDKELKYLAMNRAGLDRMRKKLEEVIGRSMLEGFPPEIAARNKANLEKVFSTGRNYALDEVLPLGGALLALETNLSPVKDSQGKTVAVLGVVRDATERRRAEISLQESEARLKDIMFTMADWVWEVDEHGRYTYSSPQGAELMGISTEEIIGKTPFDFMPPEEAQRVRPIFSEIMAKKAPIKDLENWNIKKDGQLIYLLTNGVPLLDKAGNLKGYRGVDKDITERQRALKEIQRIATFPELNPMPIVEIDRQGNLTYANPAAKNDLPDLEQKQGGHPFLVELTPYFNELGQEGKNYASRDIRLDKEWYSQTITLAGQDHLRVYSSNITEAKLQQEEVARKVRELEKFTKIMEGREDKIIELKQRVKELEALK